MKKTPALLLGLIAGPALALAAASAAATVPLVVSGGFATDPRDHGRPVILIASALGVPAEVFRDAFSRVHPAPAGAEPEPRRVRANKDALLATLGPYGVTNERLDEVSDYYRYDGRGGRLWKHRAAKLTAVVSGGAVTAVRLVDGGAGYTAAPTVTVPGHPEVRVAVTLAFGPDFAKNGSIAKAELVR